MASRSRTTFKKRQKELARMEKQRDKAAKRVQRKLEKNFPKPEDGSEDGSEDMLEDAPHDEAEVSTHAGDQPGESDLTLTK